MNDYLKKSELANLLKISQNTLNVWICKKQIPYLKLGKGKKSMVRFKREDIENWLKENQ
ncbi:MAG: helix-turn-helix domain-containing protein [Candidatus Aminicenantes bacterium]|nr:helix-turn-helix domain-containing protein [Candidatus Aminicenantes bacterium]